jgi:hypothetical protein
VRDREHVRARLREQRGEPGELAGLVVDADGQAEVAPRLHQPVLDDARDDVDVDVAA